MSIDIPFLHLNVACRLCLNQDSELCPLFSDPPSAGGDGFLCSLPSKILACVSIEVSSENNLPKKICKTCKQSVEDWVKFKEQCDKVNDALLQFVANQQVSTVEDAERKESSEVVDNLSNNDDNFDRDSLPSCSEVENESPIKPGRKTRNSNKKPVSENSSVKTLRRVRLCQKKNGEGIQKGKVKRKVKKKVNEVKETKDDPELSENGEPTVSRWKLNYDRYQKKKYVCGVNNCDKIFSRFCDLIQHDHSDHDSVPLDVTCEVCGKLFISKDRVNIHVSTYHSERNFECDVCGGKFLTKDSLRSHKRKHSGKWVCEFCGLTANSNMGLLEHRRTHTGERPFVCDVCGQKHSTKNGLNAHKRGHTKEHLFKCNVCGYSSSNQGSMYMHKSTHSLDKPCICETCGKRFKLAVRLAEHRKIHSGVKKFVCEACNLSFLTRYQLTQHSRVHSGEKPYQCDICEKKFSRSDNLREHIRTHTREKRYTCPVCIKAFTFLKSLKNHKCSVKNDSTTMAETNEDGILYCQL